MKRRLCELRDAGPVINKRSCNKQPALLRTMLSNPMVHIILPKCIAETICQFSEITPDKRQQCFCYPNLVGIDLDFWGPIMHYRKKPITVSYRVGVLRDSWSSIEANSKLGVQIHCPEALVLSLSVTYTRDLTALTTLTGLRDLQLSMSAIRDISPLSSLTNLRNLDLHNTWVTDLSPLKGLSKLMSIDLSNTEVGDLTPLTGLHQLRYLNLSYTPVTSVSPLEGLTLQFLYVGMTALSNFDPLTTLTRLKDLDLSRTLIDDLSPLIPLSSLHFLDLYGTKVKDLEPLKMFTCLRLLNVRDTMVKDYSPLRDLNVHFL